MAADKNKHISVTHFINPQLFWFHEISVPNDTYREIKDLEEQLEQYYKTHQPWTQAIRKPAIGMLVSVKFLAWHKIIRARVEHIANFSRNAHGGEYIMWAIDYGFPFQTKSDQIFRLPDKLSCMVDHIKRGGLAYLSPAEKDFDFRKNSAVTNAKEMWSQRACELVEKLVNDSESVVFVEKFQIKDHAWGDLIVTTHLGDKCNVRDYLIGMSLALDTGPIFREICMDLKVIKILPWMTNSGNSKFSSNKGFLCNGDMRDDKKMQQLVKLECNEYAKKKVEDWCARNELVTFQDSADFDTDMLFDGIAFDDSVSNKNFEIRKSKTDERNEVNKENNNAITRNPSSKQQRDLEQCVNLGSDDDDSLNSTPSEIINDQKLGMAGALAESRNKKYGKNDLPPKPTTLDFDISADSEKDLLKENNEEKVKLLSGVESLASLETGISSRKLKLLEKRKQMGNKKLDEQNNAGNHQAIVVEPERNSKQKNLIDLSSTNSTVVEIDIAKQMRNTVIHNRDSNINDKTNVPTSVVNSRVKRHLLNRHKVPLINEEDSTTDSTSANTNDHVIPQISASTKRMELLKKQRLEKLKAENTAKVNLASSHGESLKKADIQLNTEDASSIASTAKTSSHIGRLMNLRKKLNEEKNLRTVVNNTSFYNKKVKEVKSETYFELTSKSQMSPPTETLNENCTFYGMRMVPAGFDLTNLNRYKDEKNHWHRKTTTRYDYIPHSDDALIDSSSRDILNASTTSSSSETTEDKQNMQQNNFKDSRTKERNPSSLTKHANILDTTVPQIDEEPMEFFACTTERQTKNKISRMKEQQLLSSSSNVSSSTTPKKYGRYRSLKPPSTQMNKIDEILRTAYVEKESGNDEILDLKNLNSSVCKEDSDNTELYSAEDGTYGGGTTSDNEDIDSERHSSNKRSLIRSRLQKKIAVQQEHLKQVEHQLSSELNGNKPDCFRIFLPLVQEELREIEGEHRLKTKFIDHLVLAHSKVQLSSIAQTSEAFFLKEIQDEMENMRVTKLYRIQAYAWPHLLRGNSLFIVNPNKSGKTWSYLPAICSLVAYRIQICGLTDTYGPVAIIVVPTSAHVEIVHNYCKRLLLGVRPAVTTVPSFGVRNANDAKVQLLNSCGILVATPGSLLRILQDNEKESLIDIERLKHLVIDDLDLMLSRAQDDVEMVLKTFFKLSKLSKNSIPALLPWQLVVTTRDWDSLLVALMRKSNEPLLLIGDFLEAAVYGRVMISIKLCPSERKIATILEFIEQNSLENERLLVLCNSDDDVYEVVDALTISGFICISYDSHASSDVRIIVDEWRKKKVLSSRILVVADASFPELQIQNVSQVIHYSMPTSWTKFTARFSALAQTYENHVSRNFEMPAKSTNQGAARSLILLDEENSIQLPRLMDFMKKHDQLKLIHSDILAVSKRVLLEREEARILQGTRMCPYVLEFGECDEPRCEFRHNLTRFDAVSKTDNIPKAGDMRILILKVFSPTHYAARLLEHRSPNSTNWFDIRRSKEVCNFSMQLNMHYMKRENWTIHWPIHLGDLCVYKYCDTYQRIRILELPELQNTDIVKTLKLTVKLIDDGSIISGVKSDELYVCHNDFKDFPAQAINIRLSGVVPFDNERTWDTKSTKTVQKWIMTDITKKECVHVSINFTLIDTIWVNNLIVMEQLDQVGQYVYRVNLKRSLLEKNIAAAADNKRQSIREIAEEFGLLAANGDADATLSDSEMEFKTCSENETSNLMKFSSNDETMESEKLLQGYEPKEAKNFNKSGVLIKINDSLEDDGEDKEEDWDKQLNANEKTANEIYLPLRTHFEPEISEITNADTTAPTCETDTKTTTPETTRTTTTPLTSTITTTVSKQVPQLEETDTLAASIAALPTGKEQWLSLPLEQIVKVEIGSETENGNWNDIYLQQIEDEQLNKFDEMLELINDHITKLRAKPTMPFPASWFKPMQNCIVHHDNRYLRAKLYGIFVSDSSTRSTTNSSIYRFFLCDYACFIMAKPEDLYNDFLYPTTQEIVEFTPFQGVHCTLAGINLNRFAKPYKVTKDYLFAYAVKERASANIGMPHFNINSYEILLYENEYEHEMQTLELFNRTLIDKGVATADKENEHYLEMKIKLPKVPKDLCNFEDLLQCIQRSFELEMIEAQDNDTAPKLQTTPLQAIKPPQIDLPKNIKKIRQRPYKPLKSKSSDPSSGTDEEPLLSSSNKTTSSSDNDQSISSASAAHDTSSSSTEAPHLPPPPQLQAKHKRPQVCWYDTDCFIYLVISAPDISEYYLEVTEDTLIFYAEINEQSNALVLNFAGLIEPTLVSHEIRGLNVVVRLVKGVFMKWPRLLKQTTRYPWLTFNLNAIDLSEVEKLLPQQQLEMILQKTLGRKLNGSFSSDEPDSDDERNLFQTFTPIINSEDIHDPTLEIF
ncbi:putative ATP-dependent RNA helicase TDRD12 isoform X2 [Eurosta solidaginis]|uniref:putative ATP-dependent RNA helicase TDRD12 isoform X2 n=1 Tax=Eurosta solidaginis TaxID=178769 RepID=UPI003530D10D